MELEKQIITNNKEKINADWKEGCTFVSDPTTTKYILQMLQH